MRVAHIGIKKMSSTFKAVGVLIQYKSSFMLCKRSSEMASFASYWAPPSGMIEKGEIAHEAAVRELYEETRIVLTPKDIFLIWNDDKFGLFLHKSLFMYHPILDIEHVGYGYFTFEELPRKIDYNLYKLIKRLTEKENCGIN